MVNTNPGLSREALVRDLRALGLAAGDMVYVHTSMKRIGWIDGGSRTLLEAFLDVLGPEGTLAVPTHTLSFSPDNAYDPNTTPTVLGTFPEAVWRDPRALRSGHASHSSAAIGPKAAWLTEGHDPCHALGHDSPLHRLYRDGGRILMLGVTYRSCTALHLGESLSKVPYTKLHYDASWGNAVYVREADGSVTAHTQREFPGCSSGFDRIIPHLAEGVQHTGMVGAADAILVEARPLLDTAVRILQEEPAFFLCTSEKCPCCPDRRMLLQNRERLSQT